MQGGTRALVLFLLFSAAGTVAAAAAAAGAAVALELAADMADQIDHRPHRQSGHGCIDDVFHTKPPADSAAYIQKIRLPTWYTRKDTR